MRDYHDDAVCFSEERVHHGRNEIAAFFIDFLANLPEGGIEQFALRSMWVQGDVAFISWSVGDQIVLGTDTFVVADGKIVVQTYAMHAAPSATAPRASPIPTITVALSTTGRPGSTMSRSRAATGTKCSLGRSGSTASASLTARSWRPTTA